MHSSRGSSSNSLNNSQRSSLNSRAQMNQHIRSNNNVAINRSIVESSRLQSGNSVVATSQRGGRRPPQRRPGLDAKPELVDRFEHSRPISNSISNSINTGPVIGRPIAPISNSINTGPAINRQILTNPTINRQPINQPVAVSSSPIVHTPPVNTPIPITSLVPNSRPIVPVSNSLNAPNNSPINSLVSNPISSSIPINHLAPANSFIPINNNLVNSNHLTISSPPANGPVSNAINGDAANNGINNLTSAPVASPIANSITNPNSITSDAISKPIVRGRQNAGILEYNTKPERSAARPRPERVHDHNSLNHARTVSRSSSRASRITTEPSVSNNEANSIDELNAPGGGSGFGQRIRG